MKHSKQGFTLVEMLVVIAIIAVLVSIVVPAVSNNLQKAKAATDAANLRTILAVLNVNVVSGQKTVDEIIANVANPTSQYDPDATLEVIYDAPGFIDVYYVNGNTYYGLDYFSELATNGADSEKLAEIGTSKPNVPGTWYELGS